MNTKEILKILKTQKERIIQKTLDLIPSAMRNNYANRSFYIDKNGDVNYFLYSGQVFLDDTYFFTIYNFQTLEPSDYDYETYDDMIEDEIFIEDYYKDVIEESINNHIRSLDIAWL